MRVLVFSAGVFLLHLNPSEYGKAALPKEASSAIFEYEVMVSELEAPIQQLREHYLDHLGEVELVVQRSGSLEGVLEVRKEKERAKSKAVEQAAPINSPGQLVKARQIYLAEMKRAREKLIPALEKEKQHLRKRLVALMDDLTRTGKLDDAKAIKDFVESGALDKPLSTPARPEAKLSGSLKLKLQIDATSYLMIQGNEIWYDHRNGSFKPPGLHQGIFPTYLNDESEWMPVWQNKVTERFDAGVGLPQAEPAPELSIRMSDGRGYAEVQEQPSADNDYTAKIGLFDRKRDGGGIPGSDWIEFRIDW